MNINQDFDKKLNEISQFFKAEIAGIRGSRPSPALVEDVAVECYGQKMSVKQLGSISVVLPREIAVNVWDQSVAGAVAKAIGDKLSLSPSIDGTTIHVNLPSLTQERRDEIIKLVKSKTEETRIKSRTARDEIKKEVNENEKSGEITEDEKFKINEAIQKSVDKFNEEIDKELEKKISEINE